MVFYPKKVKNVVDRRGLAAPVFIKMILKQPSRLRHGGEYAEKSESIRSTNQDVHRACGQPRRS